MPRRVKIEGGARSALDPNISCELIPFVHDDLPEWNLSVGGVRTIKPSRTLWEKLLILHGLYYGFRDEGRLPADQDRVSRHYYDVAMISQSEVGKSALEDQELWDQVREHNILVFRSAWKKFEKAVPESLRITPQGNLRDSIAKDYARMQGMILGTAPTFDWIIDQLTQVESQLI